LIDAVNMAAEKVRMSNSRHNLHTLNNGAIRKQPILISRHINLEQTEE